MNHNQLKNILRNTVLAAMPVAAIVSCVPNETIKKPIKEPPHPCGEPASSKKISKAVTGNRYTNGKLPTAEECLTICGELAKQSSHFPSSFKTEFKHFKASQCASVVPPNEGFNRISCQVSYTEVKYKPSTKEGCFIPAPRPVVGRMPAGMQAQPLQHTHNLLGDYFADMARMEKAAITAFQYLVRELEAYQAPEELIQLARQAIAEEARHTKMASDLSKSYHTEVPAVIVDDFQLRSLFEVALENAVEGCVNESFAAACGLWQHAHAEHNVFRQVIGHITEEEIGHGALSWSIHEWAMPQLTAAQQAQITQAQVDAFNSLEETFQLEEHPEVRVALGLPNQTEALALIQSFRQQVLS